MFDEAVGKEAVHEKNDLYWMMEAIKEAEKARFTAPPNPWVGAVLVDKWNRKVDSAYHTQPGERHAERGIMECMHGCRLYVTLEPCSHHGRTPPCVEYLIEKKPAAIVVGLVDPDPRVMGKGITKLRAAGIEVIVGVGAAEVAHSLRPYLWHRTHNDAPYVIAKLALSLDNCFAYCTDTMVKRQWITGEHAREHGHSQRAGSQRIVVGKNTAEHDKPKLDVRYGYENQVREQPEVVRRGTHMLGDPAWLLPQWLRHACARFGPLPLGTVVTTGTWVGILPAQAGDTVHVVFDGIGVASVML